LSTKSPEKISQGSRKNLPSWDDFRTVLIKFYDKPEVVLGKIEGLLGIISY
jgi:hypothetical protein